MDEPRKSEKKKLLNETGEENTKKKKLDRKGKENVT